jgi:hypothetical protein
MRVLHSLRFLLPLLIVALIVVVAASVASARPDLQHAQHNVDATWKPLGTELAKRYLLLAAVDQNLRGVSGPTAQVEADLADALTRWRDAQHGSVATRVKDANALEAVARRVASLPRAQSTPAVKTALDAFVADRSYANAAAFNAAVAKYHRDLQGPIRGLVASALGYDEVPTFSAPAYSAPAA